MRAANILACGKICPLVLGLLLVAGCATAPPYSATVPANRSAMVAGSGRALSFSYLCKVDGCGLGRLREWHFSGHAYPETLAPVPVDPGRRTLAVYCQYDCFFHYGIPFFGYRETDLTVGLLAGHRYQIKYGRDGNRFTLWVEDMDSHQPAGEKKTVAAHVWPAIRF